MLFTACHSSHGLRLSLSSALVFGLIGAICGSGCSGPDSSAGLDADGDHVIDSLGRTLDLDNDGVADLFDIDNDGTFDGVGIDTDGDGDFDGIGLDTDGDGLIDAVDLDGDGQGDIFAGSAGEGDGGIKIGGGSTGNVDKPAGNFCDEFEVKFEPKTPTVYIVVDRSSSMFGGDDLWGQLKSGLLPVVQELQSDVRFGFASYTGVKDNYPTCGLDSGVAIAQGNYAAIESAYNGLGDQKNEASGAKGETPTSFAIQQATERLLADASPGGRFILLVSDGSPDMCGDDYNDCGVDGTIAALQIAAKQGVRTIVFGIETDTVTQEGFDKLAQAGAGQAPVAPLKNGTEDMGSYNEYEGYFANICANKGIWADLKTQNASFREEIGMAPSSFQPAGAYSSTPGSAQAFLNKDVGALADQIKNSLSGLKSCQIALNFSVTDASVGQIYVDDKTMAIPAEQWALVGDDVIELKGAACSKWQAPEVDYFFAGFPCTAIIR